MHPKPTARFQYRHENTGYRPPDRSNTTSHAMPATINETASAGTQTGLGLMPSATAPSVSLTTVPPVELPAVLVALKPAIRPAAVASGTYPAIALTNARRDAVRRDVEPRSRRPPRRSV